MAVVSSEASGSGFCVLSSVFCCALFVPPPSDILSRMGVKVDNRWIRKSRGLAVQF